MTLRPPPLRTEAAETKLVGVTILAKSSWSVPPLTVVVPVPALAPLSTKVPKVTAVVPV